MDSAQPPSPAFNPISQPVLTSSWIIWWFLILEGNGSQLRVWLFPWVKIIIIRHQHTTKPDFHSSAVRTKDMFVGSPVCCWRSSAIPSLPRGVIDLVVRMEKGRGQRQGPGGRQETGLQSWVQPHRASLWCISQPGEWLWGPAPMGEWRKVPSWELGRPYSL